MGRATQRLGKILLCVDGSPGILEYERSLFEKSGYVVVTTASALEGLRLATISSFDAVLLDYYMPGMNGHQFVAEIRRIRPKTSVVMFSGEEVPEETRKLVDAVVSKNEVASDLLPTVTRICNQVSAA